MKSSFMGPLWLLGLFCPFSTILGCAGESPNGVGCDLPSQVTQYRVEYYERSGGTCGQLDSTTGPFLDGQSQDVKKVTVQTVSLDRCNTSGAGDSDSFEIGWSRNGSIGIGTYVHDTGECKSSYDLIVTMAQ